DHLRGGARRRYLAFDRPGPELAASNRGAAGVVARARPGQLFCREPPPPLLGLLRQRLHRRRRRALQRRDLVLDDGRRRVDRELSDSRANARHGSTAATSSRASSSIPPRSSVRIRYTIWASTRSWRW